MLLDLYQFYTRFRLGATTTHIRRFEEFGRLYLTGVRLLSATIRHMIYGYSRIILGVLGYCRAILGGKGTVGQFWGRGAEKVAR